MHTIKTRELQMAVAPLFLYNRWHKGVYFRSLAAEIHTLFQWKRQCGTELPAGGWMRRNEKCIRQQMLFGYS